MIYETYTTAIHGGLIEYGYTFKLKSGDEDTVFDLVLGVEAVQAKGAGKRITKTWKDHEWAAKAICAAASKEKS